MTSRTLIRVQYLTRVTAPQVDPKTFEEEDVAHYSIPSVQENAGPIVEKASSIDSNKLQLQGHEVLVSRLNPHKNTVVQVKRNSLPILCSTEFIPFEPTGIEPRFLCYSFQGQNSIQHLVAYASSATRSHARVDPSDIIKFKIPVFQREEQFVIADYLDHETARIDELIHQKERMLELLAEKRAALVTQVVTRGLNSKVRLKKAELGWSDHIPEHWQVMQLKRTWLSSEYGISDSIREEGDIRVLRMSCITKDGRIDLANSGQVEDVPPGLFLTDGDILFNRTNSLDQIAKVGLLDVEPETPTSFASYLVRIRVNSRVSQKYLVALLNSRDFLQYARSNAIPAIGQANLSPSRYGEIRIALPPRDEQDEIVKATEQETKRTARLEKELIDSIDLLRERRSAVITAAVTGQLAVEEMTP
jgi:type I restriction enzyme S subunit